MNDSAILYLLQIASPSLPVGAYSYSEGLETLVEKRIIANKNQLKCWLEQELKYGAIRLEAALMLRSYQSFKNDNLRELTNWNHWVSAAKETKELRQQSWQMGQSLLKLLGDCDEELQKVGNVFENNCNKAIAFGIGAAHWQIETKATVIGYLSSWATNLINAGVKLIPLGQTTGQQILLSLHPLIMQQTAEILLIKNEDLNSCGWGLAIASMGHENQYTRLFRS